MDNGVRCNITSIGNIRIKMFDGVIRTLCDVRHVSEVEKNLISLGTLDSNRPLTIITANCLAVMGFINRNRKPPFYIIYL
jgi:hypothetical protein